jgi:4-hydroxy-3-polyprenylbenzoate decarboxylase
MSRLIIGMTGATGAIFGIRLLAVLKECGVETHLIISKWAERTIEHETGWSAGAVRDLAAVCHSAGDMGACISSGSFRTDGMIIAPCSMRTLAAIAGGNGNHLIHRAADVVLKERGRLVLLAREMPFSDIHLENMLKLSRMGVTILPPVPAFYNHPKTVDDIVNHIVSRTLDQFGIDANLTARWGGQ